MLYRRLFGELPAWRLVVGCLVFGAAMALRERAGNIWIRALIAGVAFAWLGWLVLTRTSRTGASRTHSP